MTTVDRINCKGLFHYSGNTLDYTDHSASTLLHQSQTTLRAIRHTNRLVGSFLRATVGCTDLCTPKNVSLSASLPGFQAEVVERTFGSRDRREKMSILIVTASDSNEISLKTMSIPLPKESRFLGLSQASFDGHYYLVVAVSTLLLVWKIPTSLDSAYNLLFVEGIEARTTEETTFGTIDNIDDTETRTAWSICRHQKLYRFDSSTNTFSARNLLDPYRFHPRAFASGILRLTEIFKNADDMSKQSILRYVERNINQYLGPKDASAAVLTHLCRSWTTESHECIHAFIKALLAQPTFRWIPIRSIGRDTNLISTLFGHLEPHLAVLDIVKVMIDYCIRQAKVDGDLMKFGPGYWMFKTGFFAFLAGFYIATIFMDIYQENYDFDERSIIMGLNLLFAWMFVLGSVRDLVILIFHGIKPPGLLGNVAFHPLQTKRIFLSISILFMLLHSLLEFRVMRTVCSFLSVMRRAGGLYDLVQKNLDAENWMVHLMMILFLFTVTIMFNVLIVLRHAPFLLRPDWFPEKVYYTANPQDVRDYRLKTQSLQDKAASAALPIDHDLQGDESASSDEPAHKAPTELSGMTSPDQHVSQQQQQLWVDQLNEDMRAEFKEELKKQLEAQLNEIMAALRSRDGSNAQGGA
ncbi:hypothetical protein BGX29_005757 [Mortierella sp. GBA35]|nr:hypothetical protein BGX29_005757 [Mortierella sp. GBA35]